MPFSPNALAIVGVVASFSAVIAALISGIFVLINGRITNKKTTEIEQFKSELSGDIEKLKAQLGYGQVVNTTQWNAEFNAYQAIWKAMMAVRAQAPNIVFREVRMSATGLGEHLDLPTKINHRTDLLSKLSCDAESLFWAIHNNAPFYPASIRKEANDTHHVTKRLIDKELMALTPHMIGGDTAIDEDFLAKAEDLLGKIFEGVDLVESLIRDRLAAIQVVNRTI